MCSVIYFSKWLSIAYWLPTAEILFTLYYCGNTIRTEYVTIIVIKKNIIRPKDLTD